MAHAGGSGGSGGRIALFDNCKGVLIALVVTGHVMHPVHTENPTLSCLFDLIYLFHMPLFVFLSGLFAKRGSWSEGRLRPRRVLSFAALALAFQAALLAVNGDLDDPTRLLMLSSAPWYMMSMAWWYLLVPVLARLRPAAGMGLSLAVSLAWGCVDLSNGLLAISRTLEFLPWFAAGYYLTRDQVVRLAEDRRLWWAVGLAGGAVALRVAVPDAYDWFFPLVYGDNPYEAGVLVGIEQKCAATAMGLVLSLAALRLVPRGESSLTELGRRTLQVYVLHRLARAWLTFHTVFYDDPVMADPVVGTAIVLAASAVVLVVTSWQPPERDGRRTAEARG